MSTWAFLAAPFIALRRKPDPAPAPVRLPVAVAPPISRDTAPPRREAHDRQIQRRDMSTLLICDRFVTWMREQGCYGYWLVSEIDEYMQAFCDMRGWAVPHPLDARSRLVEIPGVARGRWSIKTAPEFYDVRIRTDMARPTLYRISREVPVRRSQMPSDMVMTVSGHSHDYGRQGVTQPKKRKARQSVKGVRGVSAW